MKEPRYSALVSGMSGMSGTSRDEMSGVVRKKGAQKGQLHCESASAVREKETGRAAGTVRSRPLDPGEDKFVRPSVGEDVNVGRGCH